DRRARRLDRARLVDRDGRRDPLDRVRERTRQTIEELPRVRGERLDVATLSLGVEGVEGERRLPRPARPRDDRQLADRNVAIDAAKVVLPYAAKPDRGMRRGAIRARPRLRWRFRLGGGAYARARASSDHEIGRAHVCTPVT